MNGTQLKQLSRMKELITLGKRRFQNRPDRDYLSDLVELGISEEEAWNYILLLNKNFYFYDTMPSYYNTKALTFKRKINGINTYIKLKIEKNNDEEVVCLSFHKDN